MAMGHNGRSSRTGYTATVFGASGFLGRYLTSRLAKNGTITVVPFRDDLKKRFLKVPGDLGVVNFVEFDFRNLESINEAVRMSDIVFNLAGVDYNTKNFSMADVNIESARRVAKACAENGVPRLVHVSSYNASKDSSSVFYATKALGEEAVLEEYPDATIVRPGPIYGMEDNFLNYLGNQFRLFTINHMKETMYPVHVLDVTTALEKIGFDDTTTGGLYELNGPESFSVKEIRQLIQAVTKRHYTNINLPKSLALRYAAFLQNFWWPMTNPDQVERQYIDQVIDTNALGFKDLGIEPDRLQDLVYRYTFYLRDNLHQQDLPPTAKELQAPKTFFTVAD
jgi:NADH dehydrogenase (ubiquinone) 1 alpha subcomplex subunit 9